MTGILDLIFFAVIANTKTALDIPTPSTPQSVVLEVPFVDQIENLPTEKKKEIRNTACGPAAITMALNYMNYNISLWDVIDKLPTTVYIKGKMFYNLPAASNEFDKVSVSIAEDYKSIYETLKDEKPIIMNIQNYDNITGHAVLVVGIKNFNGTTAESLIVHDPYRGPYREFKYYNKRTLVQPEGYLNYIGTLKPFYLVNKPTDKLAFK